MKRTLTPTRGGSVTFDISLGEGHPEESARVARYEIDGLADLAELFKEHPSTKSGGAYITPGPMGGDRRNKKTPSPPD